MRSWAGTAQQLQALCVRSCPVLTVLRDGSVVLPAHRRGHQGPGSSGNWPESSEPAGAAEGEH